MHHSWGSMMHFYEQSGYTKVTECIYALSIFWLNHQADRKHMRHWIGRPLLFRVQISEHLLFDASKTLTAEDSMAMSTLWQQGCVLKVMGILWLFHFFVFLMSSVTAGRLEVGNTTSTDNQGSRGCLCMRCPEGLRHRLRCLQLLAIHSGALTPHMRAMVLCVYQECVHATAGNRINVRPTSI